VDKVVQTDKSKRKERVGERKLRAAEICPACLIPAFSKPETMYQHLTLKGERNLCAKHKPLLIAYLEKNNLREHLKLLGERAESDKRICRFRNRKVKAESS